MTTLGKTTLYGVFSRRNKSIDITTFTESIVEDAALAWLNPDLPAAALDDSYQMPLAALRDTLLPKLLL